MNSEEAQEAIYQALREWHNQAADLALDQWLLVRHKRQTAPAEPGLRGRTALKQVLQDGLAELERQDETAARVLRWRFFDDQTLLMVAHRLNVSEHTVSRQQRAAIGQLAAILQQQEQLRRDEQMGQMVAHLPPPAYTRLFGVQAARQELAGYLLLQEAPWVVVLVGIGGIGKTALADAVVREVIGRFRFEGVAWLRHDPRTMSGRALSPEHAFDTILAQLFDRLGLLPPNAPAEQRLLQVLRRLKEQPHLVVVDNLESEAVADYLLNRLADLAAPSKFVITTRTHPPEQAAVRHFPLPELLPEDALALPFLMIVPLFFIYIALIAWVSVFMGMLAHLTGFRRVAASSG